VDNVREDDIRNAVRRAEERVGHAEYGPGALDEVTLPPTDDRREAKDRDIQDPADVPVDPDVLRDGGPTRNRGVVTTTGGTAGPASVRRLGNARGNRKVAPTTTGDATTGGMSTPTGGSTSDAASQASRVGNFTDR
jgi:hypothetical protein